MSWQEFWFQPGDPIHLGFVRVMFFLILFVVARGAMLPLYAQLYRTVPSAYLPVTFYTWFPTGFATFVAERMRLLLALWYLAIFLGATGLFFPLGNIAATLLTLIVIGFRKQFGKINHARNIMPLFALILACAPADAWCVYPLFEITKADHGYFWPIQLGRVLISTVWFLAGVAKLRYGGLAWAFSDNLVQLLRVHVMDYYFVPPKAPWLARWIPRHPYLCVLLAVGTYVIELGYPLALFHPWAAMFFVPASLVLIMGFSMAQGPLFLPLFTLTIVVWLPFPK